MFLLDRLRPADDPVTGRRSADGEHVVHAGERGAIVAVGGASGSGAREIAIALAAAFAGRGLATLLIDVNETTPGVARRLGLGVYPHLLTALDRLRAENAHGIDAALADRVVGLPFDVIVGLPTPRDWDRVVSNDLEALLEVCCDRWDRVVVTTSPLIEDLQRWGDRFGISRRALSIADAVVGCAEPSPRGVLRYLDWLADLSGLGSTAITVLNKSPRTRRVSSEATRQLRDVGGALIDDVVGVPLDRAVAAAEWDGVLVKRGPFTKAIASIRGEVDRVLARTSVEVSS